MRTTVTLDPDVERLLKKAMKTGQLSFKEALNAAVRRGLGSERVAAKRFNQKTHSMGTEQPFRWDKALATAAAVEDEELSRKLALRK